MRLRRSPGCRRDNFDGAHRAADRSKWIVYPEAGARAEIDAHKGLVFQPLLDVGRKLEKLFKC